MVFEYLGDGAGEYLDSGLAGLEVDGGYDVPCAPRAHGLLGLFFGGFVADGYVAPVSRVYARHDGLEDVAVGGGVVKAVPEDEVVDHLVDYGVFDDVLGQVEACVYA